MPLTIEFCRNEHLTHYHAVIYSNTYIRDHGKMLFTCPVCLGDECTEGWTCLGTRRKAGCGCRVCSTCLSACAGSCPQCRIVFCAGQRREWELEIEEEANEEYVRQLVDDIVNLGNEDHSVDGQATRLDDPNMLKPLSVYWVRGGIVEVPAYMDRLMQVLTMPPQPQQENEAAQ